MSKWKSRVAAIIALLLVIGGAAYYWLVMESHMPGDAAFTLDIEGARKLADSLPGDKPVAIHAEQVAEFTFPATAIVAGDGWTKVAMPVFSYQLVYSDGVTGIIDTGLDKKSGEASGTTSFDQQAYDRMSAALHKARFILMTHEHMDHIGGLAAQADIASLHDAVRITAEQQAHPERMLPVAFPAGALEGFTPLVYGDMAAIAPGVVVIKSPGHSPGSQMVYVRRADGREYLFLGDVAWQFRNIETQRERARLVTQFLLKEDRHQVFGELKALAALHQSVPELIIVPGHDGKVIADLLSDGMITAKFE